MEYEHKNKELKPQENEKLAPTQTGNGYIITKEHESAYDIATVNAQIYRHKDTKDYHIKLEKQTQITIFKDEINASFDNEQLVTKTNNPQTSLESTNPLHNLLKQLKTENQKIILYSEFDLLGIKYPPEIEP